MDSWIVGGDFNNVESIDDVCIFEDHLPRVSDIATAERDAWDNFLFSMSLSDAWHIPAFAPTSHSLLFSWGFRRQGGRLLERLDRFYVGQWIADRGGTTTIWPRTALSVISLRIHLHSSLARRRGRRIPDSTIRQSSLQGRIRELWTHGLDTSASPQETLAMLISSSSSLCRDQATLDREALRQRERDTHVSLAAGYRVSTAKTSRGLIIARS